VTDTETPPTSEEQDPTTPNADPVGPQAGQQSDDDGGMFDDERRPVTYLFWGAFGVLLLLALVATVRFYLSASNAISIWVADDYVPIFQSAFNLAVLFACGLGLSVLVRRLRD